MSCPCCVANTQQAFSYFLYYTNTLSRKYIMVYILQTFFILCSRYNRSVCICNSLFFGSYVNNLTDNELYGAIIYHPSVDIVGSNRFRRVVALRQHLRASVEKPWDITRNSYHAGNSAQCVPTRRLKPFLFETMSAYPQV